MAERLRTLKGAEGVRAFAERIGLGPSLVSGYLNGTRLPESPTLRTIAERTGVSLDWLLLGDGDGEPRYRGQSRTRTELETDVSAHVARVVADRLGGRFLANACPVTAADLTVSGAAFLEQFAADCADDLSDWVEARAAQVRQAVAVFPLGGAHWVAVDALQRAVKEAAPGSLESETVNAAVVELTSALSDPWRGSLPDPTPVYGYAVPSLAWRAQFVYAVAAAEAQRHAHLGHTFAALVPVFTLQASEPAGP